MASQQQPELSIDVLASQGLRCIRQLRQQTHRTLDFLREGVQSQNDDVLSDDQIFTKDAKQRLLAIMETFEQLEKLSNMLPKPSPNFGGNLNYLMQNAISEGPFSDADTSVSTPYENVLNTYNWLQRSQEYSQLSTMFVGQYVRRNQSKLFRRPPAVTGWTIQQLNQQLLPACQKLVPGLQINTIARGRNTILIFVTVCAVSQVSPGTPAQSPLLKIVILARAQPFTLEWANVKGSDEDFYDDSGNVDLHSPSRYRVFQKLSNHVKGALLHHMSMINSPGQYLQNSLKTFFMWLGMYRNLFTDSCVGCKRILRDYLPPFCRDYRKIDQAFHEACK